MGCKLKRVLEALADGLCLQDIVDRLDAIDQKLERLMALVDDLKAGMQKIDQETTALGDVVRELRDRLANQALSDAEKQEILDSMTAVADRLTGLASDPNNPIPPGNTPQAPRAAQTGRAPAQAQGAQATHRGGKTTP